jgi:hypothetical protein
MPEPLSKLLAEATGLELCCGLMDHILAFYGNEPEPAEMPEPERVALLVLHTKGIIDNGGFNYLFGADLPGDLDYSLTAEAYERVGCEPAAEAFRRAMNLFPGGKPPRETETRIRIYRSGTGERRGEIDAMFIKAGDQLEAALARYIRLHAEEYTRLEGPRVEPKKPRRKKGKEQPRQLDPVAVGISKLPHWARVAFAAHCARAVFPFFNKLWPNALPHRRVSVQTAIDLAERAAVVGRSARNLKDAVLKARISAGGALAVLFGGYPSDHHEPGPPDGNAGVAASNVAGVAASNVAGVAVNAAEAARYPAARSAEFALHAYALAREIAWEMDPDLVGRMAADFQLLRRAARRGRWTNRTPVAPSVFTPTARESETRKP